MKSLLLKLLLASVCDLMAVATISFCAQCALPWAIALFLAAALAIVFSSFGENSHLLKTIL
jgi:hypothetical protein